VKLSITARCWRRLCLVVPLFLLFALAAFPQTTLTGAVQFSTNSTGAAAGGQVWNTLGGDSYYDLWFALDPAATSPINGPSDADAGISIPLAAGSSYSYYIFGQPNTSFTFNGLNLFFDGNNSTPGISVFGPIDSPAFLPNGSSTLTLGDASVAGSGSIAYGADGVVVVVTGYEWHVPETPPGDVCQAKVFAPGDGADYFGSFSLQVFPEATLAVSQPSGSPETNLTLTGSGFLPTETVGIFAGRIGGSPLGTVPATSSGSFSVTFREAQHPYGPLNFFALGETSQKLGVANFFVTPVLLVSPSSGLPGATITAQGLGFGAAETVSVYWNNPRQLLGTATANSEGSFAGSGALTITIPANASPGLNAVIGIGQTTRATGIGKIEVE